MTGAQFRAARLALGLSSQDAAARFLGVSLRTAHNYENDSRPIPTATAKLLRLMCRLNVSPNEAR